MNLAFINPALIFDVDTPYTEPLGGSESALCYLSEHLAKLGHRVFLLTRLPKKSKKRGVFCVPFDQFSKDDWSSLDVFVMQNDSSKGFAIKKKYLSKKTKLVLWTQHAHDQPAIASLSENEVRNSYDYFVMVSTWQLECYRAAFGIKKDTCFMLKNAIAPSFANLFTDSKQLMSQKTLPPVLAYTSTPFRGLDLLLYSFPIIRRAVPGITLRVYSSLKVYQVPAEFEQKYYGNLYRLCRENEGIEYIGSLPQTELARQLQTASIFAYPNTFAETCCTSALEALASGCQIVTSDLGALPETTAGFAKLIPVNGNWREYSENFIQATITSLQQFLNNREETGHQLFKQTKYTNQNDTWTQRALEWDNFLTKIWTR